MLSDFEGRPVILDFWASWCGPCRQQHEYVMGLGEKYGDAVQIVGVVFEDSDENARAWLEEHGATYPTVREVDGAIVDAFWVSGIPYFIMTTPDRRLSWDFFGATNWSADSVTTRLAEMTGLNNRHDPVSPHAVAAGPRAGSILTGHTFSSAVCVIGS